MRKWFFFLVLTGMVWSQPDCYLKGKSFLKMETGVHGGFAFSRDSELLVIPDGSDGATVWSEQGSKYRKGTLGDYAELASELDRLGLYSLKNYQPSMEALDPYASGATAIHAHDGKRCFSYSPQRDCTVMGKGEVPSEAERNRFAAIVERLQKLNQQATSPVTREQFQAAEQALWKS